MPSKVWVAAAVLLLLRPSPPFPVSWQTEQPRLTRRLASLPDTLRESSGIVPIPEEPGHFWSFNDSGHEPMMFAVDSSGRVVHQFRVGGATDEDWEAAAVGPCGPARCLYIGDIGDNRSTRREAVLYRVPEDSALAADSSGHRVIAAERVEFRYPDGPRNAESLLILPNGDAVVIAKPMVSTTVPYFRIPAEAWSDGKQVTATELGALAIDPRSGPGGWVTDATLDAGGRVVVRTYRMLYFFHLTSGGTLEPGAPAVRCDIAGLEAQGEGIGWEDDTTLVLSSERVMDLPATLDQVRCPAFAP
jgi:hypothetical protein